MNDRQRAINAIENARCIALTTFKRDGTAVSTPIWFNLIDGRIFVTTEPHSWKVRRISNDPRVEFAACTQRGRVTGQTFTGRARVIDADDLPPVLAAKKRRYASFRLIHLFKKEQVGIEITPGT